MAGEPVVTKDAADEPARRLGRPHAADKGASVTTWVRVRDYDKLLELAKKHDKSISGVVRDLLRLRLR